MAQKTTACSVKAMKQQPFIFEVRNGSLSPADMWTAERMDGYRQGAVVRVDKITLPRSLPWQGHYWVGLTNIIKATECAPTADHLHKALLKLCRYTTPVTDANGRVIELVVDSTAFDKMNQPEFEQYVERAKAALAEQLRIVWDDYQRRAA